METPSGANDHGPKTQRNERLAGTDARAQRGASVPAGGWQGLEGILAVPNADETTRLEPKRLEPKEMLAKGAGRRRSAVEAESKCAV